MGFRFWRAKALQAELEAARLLKQKEDEEAKQAAQQAKKEKEIQKKAIKKERQKLRATCKVLEARLKRKRPLFEPSARVSPVLSLSLSLHRTGIISLTMKRTA